MVMFESAVQSPIDHGGVVGLRPRGSSAVLRVSAYPADSPGRTTPGNTGVTTAPRVTRPRNEAPGEPVPGMAADARGVGCPPLPIVDVLDTGGGHWPASVSSSLPLPS